MWDQVGCGIGCEEEVVLRTILISGQRLGCICPGVNSIWSFLELHASFLIDYFLLLAEHSYLSAADMTLLPICFNNHFIDISILSVEV